MFQKPFLIYSAALLLVVLNSVKSWSCACGCGVFDVGTSSMFPTSAGGMIFMDYDYLNQNQNRNGNQNASSADNPDKLIRSHFLTLTGEYMFDRSWGAELDLPYTFRTFRTTDSFGNVNSFSHSSLGDVHLKGIYTGFSPDMSSGIIYGVRLPTGDSTYPNFDPDTEIGSGSTDLLLGYFHRGAISQDGLWSWYAQINLDQPILTEHNYFPGSELDAAYGAYYNGINFGSAEKLTPIVQLLTTLRASDHGGNAQADPLNTGYERLYISPGLETDIGSFKLYGDVEFPIYQYLNGMQLVAPELFKFIVGYSF